MKLIGILGGSSDQATADYYGRINRAVGERLGRSNTGEMLINSMNFQRSREAVHQGRWDELGRYLAERARALEGAGAAVLICVSNTLHRLAPTFTAGLKIPFLHIVDPTAAAIRAAGLKRVGFLGTKAAMSGDFLHRRYRENFGVETVAPRPEAQDRIDHIIFEELCLGEFSGASKQYLLDCIGELRGEGAEGVILGCTELPLLLKQSDMPGYPAFDTTGLHVSAVVDFSLRGA